MKHIEQILKNILESGAVPCLKGVSLDTGGEGKASVDFSYSRIDFKTRQRDTERDFRGFVMEVEDREHARILGVVIPRIFDTSKTSVQEDYRAFGAGASACGAGPGAKFVLQNHELSIVADSFVLAGATDAQLKLLLHSALRSVICCHYRWALHMWAFQAKSVLPGDELKKASQACFRTISESIGDSPFGDEVGGSV